MSDPSEDLFRRVLLLETSGKIGYAAVASGTDVLAQRELAEARRHARDLAVFCAELLEGQGWKPRDLSAVVVNIGPGSYTGLRVGIASGKVLAYALGIPMLGVPAFESVAISIPKDERPLHVLADALQGFVYQERFEFDDAWKSRTPLRIVRLDEWQQELGGPILVAGPGVEIHRPRLTRTDLITELPTPTDPCASLLAAARLQPNHFRVDAALVEPLYLRGSSAEEKRKQAAGG